MGFGLGISLTSMRRAGGGDPFASLMSTLLAGSAQLIAHPLEYGSMFQDRAGTTPVTEAGQLVGHCLDAGGGGYHATAISDAARGVFREVDGIRYIEYNGVNTAYATPALPAPGVDKAQVFAGVRKLSDATAILLELSSLTNLLANVGSFYVTAPEDASIEYASLSRGSAGLAASQRANITGVGDAPDSAIITATHDISGDLSTIRRNGVAGTNGTGEKGAGNYNPEGTYPLYYGARAGTSFFFNGRSYATLGPIVRFSTTNATAEQVAAAEAYYTARVI